MIYTIDCGKMVSREAAFEHIRQALDIRDYMGSNLDALWDVLGGFAGEIRIFGREKLALPDGYGEKILQVFEDAAKENDGIRLEYITQEPQEKAGCLIAPPLREGGTIGICSPSHIADREGYAPVIAAMKALGFRVKEAPNLYKATYGYLASPQERADDFNALIADDEVDMVFFGGGEAGNELLPLIDYENIKAHPKRICSYSDGTFVLTAVWSMTGMSVYYGSSPSMFSEPTAYNLRSFREHIMADAASHQKNSEWKTLTGGSAEGILWGGYLRNVALMAGCSPYLRISPEEKYVLLLEDHEQFGDRAYVSAMLSHIEQTGFMDRVSGILFGHYSETEYPELFARLARMGEKYAIPAVYCDDFGHGVNRGIFDIGRRVRFDADNRSLEYI